MKVLVGSENPTKIESVRQSFLNFSESLEVEGILVDTGVSEQPINNEVFEGAKNRAESVKKVNDEQSLGATFFIGIEGGALKFHDRWFSLNVIYILDEQNRGSFGTTGLYELPGVVSKDLLVGKDFGLIIGELANDHSTVLEYGTIGLLTDGKIDRLQNQVQGIAMALIPFINENLYFSDF